MSLKHEVLEKGFMYVHYDIPVSKNSERNWLRQKLLYQFNGIKKSDSVYFLSKAVTTIEDLRQWADSCKVNIEVISLDPDDVTAEQLSQTFVTELHNRFDEVNEFAQRVWKEMTETEENIDKPNVNWRGFHFKIEGVTHRFEGLQWLLNRVGKEKDKEEFEFQKLTVFMEDLQKRFERLRGYKVKRVEEGHGI